MRQLKFRAWRERTKEFIYIDIQNEYERHARFFEFEWDGSPLMQYTGLKDINNKEIYEGDIVADYDGDGIHVVEYYEDCFCLVRYSWKEGRDMKKRSPTASEWWDTLEVVGSIDENPDLLE